MCAKMGYTKSAVLFLILIIICSVFVANVSNLISVGGNAAWRPTSKEGQLKAATQDGARMGNSTDHLMWFLQVKLTHQFLLSLPPSEMFPNMLIVYAVYPHCLHCKR